MIAPRLGVDVIDPNEPPPDPSSTMELVSTRRRTAASAVRARTDATRLMLIAVGGAGALAGVVFVLTLGWLRGEVPVQTAAAAAPPATSPPTVATAPLVEATPAPAWTGERKASWASDGSKTIAFELRALRDAPAWMTSVRPVLVVQCLSRTTQTFVALGTSANFESDALHRTVRVQWDDETELVQRWQASESGQELFAPDGVAFVRRLTSATRLRFGFTPFNAQPIVAEFVVEGFDELAGLVATTCGWRL